MNTDKLDRIALEVALDSCINPCAFDERGQPYQFDDEHMLAFARRLVARLQQEAEPIGDIDEDGNIVLYEDVSGPIYTSSFGQPAQSAEVLKEAIGRILAEVMDTAVSNGANSVSMPDHYVEVAAWLCGVPAAPARPVGGEGE